MASSSRLITVSPFSAYPSAVGRGAFTTRRVPQDAYKTVISGTVRPRAGDLVLAEIKRLGQHKPRSGSSLDTSCAANWQGANRYARGQAYFRDLGTALGDAVYDRQRLAVVPSVGHSAHDMFTSSVAAQTLFP